MIILYLLLNWHNFPVNPQSQKHVEFLQVPCALQLLVQVFSLQSSPIKPLLQRQFPFTHNPLSEQLFLHFFIEQSSPSYPSSH